MKFKSSHLPLKGGTKKILLRGINMQKEQTAVILYTILGCVVGYVSLQIKNFIVLLALVLGIYFVTVIPLSKKITVDKLVKWLLSNTFIVYILVWLMVYILLSNITV
jgi:uncharacterized membrane protein (Fun14 family)